jgi:hypothetical protein
VLKWRLVQRRLGNVSLDKFVGVSRPVPAGIGRSWWPALLGLLAAALLLAALNIRHAFQAAQ